MVKKKKRQHKQQLLKFLELKVCSVNCPTHQDSLLSVYCHVGIALWPGFMVAIVGPFCLLLQIYGCYTLVARENVTNDKP